MKVNPEKSECSSDESILRGAAFLSRGQYTNAESRDVFSTEPSTRIPAPPSGRPGGEVLQILNVELIGII